MKENQRVKLTKRLLQEGLLRLLKEKPIDKITISELCVESGVNRATFYRHYSLPQDVLLEMERNMMDELQDRFGTVEISGMADYMEAFCTYLYERADLLRIFIQNISEKDMLGLFDDLFTRVIRMRRDPAIPAEVDDVDIRLITTYIAGGGYHVLRQWLMEEVRKTPKEIARLFLLLLEYTTSAYREHGADRTAADSHGAK